MTHERLTLRSRRGEPLRADLRYTDASSKQPVVVYLHGFKGFKDWGPFPTMLEALTSAGYITLAFNFSHNGIGEDLLTFSEPERFAQNTLTRDLEEVEDVLAAVLDQQLPIDPALLDTNRIALIGHSRGAATAIVAGSRMESVKAVIALAPVARFIRWTKRQADEWHQAGFVEITNQRTGQILRLNSSFLDDYEAHRNELDILAAARKLAVQRKPFLILTGSEDLTAPVHESQEIAEAASGAPSKFEIIPNTGHTFGTEHPFRGMTPAFEEVIERSRAFLDNALGSR